MAVIKKPSKVLQGQINMAAHAEHSKPISGSETDSIKISVTDNVISGDVKWKSQLGYTADKAYPGNDGVKNRTSIEGLIFELQAVSDSLTALKKSIDSDLQETTIAVSKLDKRVDQLEKTKQEASITEVLQKLTEETNRALQVEQQLADQILVETASRQDQDDNLHIELSQLQYQINEQLTTINSTLNKKIDQLKNDQSTLNDKISIERSRAISSEASIRQTLTDNQKTHEHAIEELKTQIESSLSYNDTKFDAVDDRITRVNEELQLSIKQLQDTDSALDSKISKIILDIGALNNTLENLNNSYLHLLHYYEELNDKFDSAQNDNVKKFTDLARSIDTETIRAQSAESQLETKITDVTSVVNENKNLIKQNESTINEVKTSVDNLSHQVHRDEEKLDKLQEKVDTIGSIGGDVSVIKDQLDQVKQDLVTETTRATGAEKTINDKLDSAIESTDKKLQELADQVVSLDGAVKIVPNENIEQLYGQLGEDVVLQNLDVEAIANSVVKRDSNGNVIVPVNGLTNTSAVPKSIMDEALATLSATLTTQMDRAIKNAVDSMQFDFIDGGMAPVDK